MWKNINKLNQEGNKYNMILTTHSMEEAEVYVILFLGLNKVILCVLIILKN